MLDPTSQRILDGVGVLSLLLFVPSIVMALAVDEPAVAGAFVTVGALIVASMVGRRLAARRSAAQEVPGGRR